MATCDEAGSDWRTPATIAVHRGTWELAGSEQIMSGGGWPMTCCGTWSKWRQCISNTSDPSLRSFVIGFVIVHRPTIKKYRRMKKGAVVTVVASILTYQKSVLSLRFLCPTTHLFSPSCCRPDDGRTKIRSDPDKWDNGIPSSIKRERERERLHYRCYLCLIHDWLIPH